MKPESVFSLENAAWPALLVNGSGSILQANAAAKTVFGAAVNGDSAQLASIWLPENGGSAPDFLARWEQTPSAVRRLLFRTASGAVAAYSTAACQFGGQDGAGNILLQLLPVADAVGGPNDRTSTGDTVLKQKLDCVLQLARTVSLDFNNALTGVLAHTSLLLTKAEQDHPWRRSLLEVEKSAARAAEIASELAQFSRQEKETRAAPPGNLNVVVNRCVEFFQNTHGTRFNWKLGLERSLFGARFDEMKVQQALTKIIENAVEAFGVSGSGQISVQTRNVELTGATQDRNVRLNAGTYVCVEITDNGSGIEAEVLPRIFEPFFTTKRPPHRGLGLAMAYGMVTTHGGGVAISSQPGMGTSARIYLPAEKSLVNETVVPSNELRGSGTILVVDDESIVLRMAETILTEFGYKVLTVNGGPKALALLGQPGTTVNLVITDLVMPGMGGRELAEKIRQQFPGLPVIPMSGYVLPEDKKGSAGYLQKPFTSTELLRKVRQAVSSS